MMSTKLMSIAGGFLVLALLLFTSGKSGNLVLKATNDSHLLDVNNRPVNITDFKGKVVFVNNWASWCPPCVAEMKSIQGLKGELDKKDFVFVMVSYDEDHEKAISFIKRKGYDLTVYFPGGKYPFATESIPATYVLDRTGKIVREYSGMQNYGSRAMIDFMKSVAQKELTFDGKTK